MTISPSLVASLFAVGVYSAVTFADSPPSERLQPRDLDLNSDTVEAYFDTELGITWLADANIGQTVTFGLERAPVTQFGSQVNSNGLMQQTAVAQFVAGMNGISYLGYNGWRLPTATVEGDETCSISLRLRSWGTGCSGREVGSLNKLITSADVTFSPFGNVHTGEYWLGSSDESGGHYFYSFGENDFLDVCSAGRVCGVAAVWPVHDGDIGTPISEPCVDGDSDGWGWNGVRSCRVTEPVSGECIDLDGDGWGWDGVQSCKLETIVTQCHDTAPVGDGWGWNGLSSCVIRPSKDNRLTMVGIPGAHIFFGYQLSDNGATALFESYEPILNTQTGNGYANVFLRDNDTGDLALLSQGQGGAESDNSSLLQGSTADGSKVLITSYATNLPGMVGNGTGQLYLYDVQTTAYTAITTGLNGQIPWRGVKSAAISADGSTVVYDSYAANLVANDQNNSADIFLYDVVSGQTQRVTPGFNGDAANDNSRLYDVSADGRFIVFQSGATNLLPATPEIESLYVYDSVLDTLSAVPAIDNVRYYSAASISDDGSKIVYQYAVPGGSAIALFDLSTEQTRVVDQGSDSSMVNGSSNYPIISGDGRYVAYTSNKTNLIDDVEISGEHYQLYLTDLSSNVTVLVSRSSENEEANRRIVRAQFIASDRYLRFNTDASNLVLRDGQDSLDTFLYKIR